MEGKELIAKNPLNGMQICERFIDGERFIKVTPSNLSKLILPKLREQFKEMPVEMTESTTGWLKIKKLEGADDNKKLKKVADDAANQLTGDTILEKEADLLKKAGFQVEVKDI